MPAIASIIEILFTVAAIAAPPILFAALLRDDHAIGLANVFRAPDFNAWPRGVQEEEPFRWGTTAS